MEKITQIDLLVHPFFRFWQKPPLPKIRKEWYLKDEANLLRYRWEERIKEIKKDKKWALVFVGNNLEQNHFEQIKKGVKGKSYEARLLEYAHANLGERLFFFEESLTNKELRQFKGITTKEVTVYFYGELLTGCGTWEASILSRVCGIPKKQFVPLPELSIDREGRHPPPWQMSGVMPEQQKKNRSRRLKKYEDEIEYFRTH